MHILRNHVTAVSTNFKKRKICLMRAKESVELLIYSLTIFHRQTCVFHVNIAEAEASNYWRLVKL